MTGPACILGDQSCYGTLDACNASNIGYRPSADCKSGPACIGETGCYGLQTECQQMACIGITDSTLAKDIPVPCLQQTWLNAGCTKTGSWYPIDNYNGWWKASPSGSTMVYCYGDQVPGNSPGNCGAGTFGVVKADMAVVASRDTVVHREACGN